MKSHETDKKVRKEILVVDDCYDSVYLLKNILEGHGYQVRPTSDGCLALRTVAVQVPDIILLDVRMPGMDGYEVCRRLKSEEKTCNVPVIFISALNEPTDKIQGFEAGGVDFITKPFEPEEVLARVRTHLQLRDLTECLEKKVRKRTRELQDANQQLRRKIDEQALIEKALKESEQKLVNIIDFYPDATFVINQKGEVISWNKKIEAMTGIQACDILGKGNYEYALPFHGVRRPVLIDMVLHQNEDIKKLKEKYAYISRKGQHLIGETYVTHLKGGKYYLMATCAPLYDSNGNIIGAIESLRDITKRKKAEIALQRAHDKLESKVMKRTAELTAMMEQAQKSSQAKQEFLTIMSHELRTPLNAILGYTYILKRSKNLTDEQKKHLKIIHRNGEHLLALIDDILNLSRIESGKMKLDLKAFNLQDLISSVINTARIKAKQKNLFVNFENNASSLPIVIGDEKKLQQVLLNLLDNAIRYTEQGGVTFRVSTDKHPSSVEKHTIPPQTKPGDPSSDNRKLAIRIEIEDTGPGISEENIETIFEIFKQVRPKKSAIEGIGMGLAISRRMVEMMGGSLLVQSTVGKGSLFMVLLSLNIESVDALYKPLNMNLVGYIGERKKLLIVDDDIMNLSMLVSLLDPLDFKIETAESGPETLAKAKNAVPDLILLDLLMPDMDGIETIYQIKTDERLKTTKVIGVSAAVADKSFVKTFAEMCDDFVPKPVDPIALFSKLKVQLQIEWIHGDKTSATPAMEQETTIKMPPRTILEKILKRIERGEISRLEKIVLALEDDDETYTNFCARIRKYLDDFDEKSLIKLITLKGRLDG